MLFTDFPTLVLAPTSFFYPSHKLGLLPMPMNVADLPSFLRGEGGFWYPFLYCSLELYEAIWSSEQGRSHFAYNSLSTSFKAQPFPQVGHVFSRGGRFSGVDTLEMVMGIPFFLF